MTAWFTKDIFPWTPSMQTLKISETTRELSFDYLLSPVNVEFCSFRGEIILRLEKFGMPGLWHVAGHLEIWSHQQDTPHYRGRRSFWFTETRTGGPGTGLFVVSDGRNWPPDSRFRMLLCTSLHGSRIHLSPGFFKENHRVKSVIRFDAFKWYLSKSDPANPWCETLFG